MFSNREANSKALAVTLVSVLMICSFAVMFASESDAAYDEDFDIYMRTGDLFSYTPDVNLDGTTIAATGTAFEGDHLNWSTGETWQDGATITGSFAAAGTYTLVLTATWTSGNLSQTATQTINFHVSDRLVFNPASGSSAYTLDDVTSGLTVASGIQVQSGSHAGTVEYNATITKNGGADNGLFQFSNGSITSTRQATTGDEGHYVVTVTAGYAAGTSNGVTDSATYTYTIDVGADLTVTGGDLETYVGNSNTEDNTFTIVTNYDGQEIPFTYTVTDDSGVDGAVVHEGNANTFSINTNAAGLVPDGEQSKTFTVTVQVSGDVDSDSEAETAQTTVNVTVYAGLAFTSEPEMSNVSMQSATGNALDALATASFEGATHITYNWGDGTSTSVDVTPNSGSLFSARHVYSQAGTYAVTITAENDHGASKAIMLYDATSGQWNAGTEEDVPEEGQTFFEEHGILFIVFAILAILMIVLFFFIGIQHPIVPILAIVFVIAAVACFIGADFGLTEGLIESLNI